ncbi:MAG: DUF4105 domain-containing protein [Prevotellaceae bacterium]|nr:DUF4105 domain-containing protein [Prevotellaceae bacterium]
MEAISLITAPHDSIRLSLLTCAAGDEIYSLFGHSAIRYENYTQKMDLVFNYGIFNFNTPNFVFRFALGETDYRLGAIDYERFIEEYVWMKRTVWQQTLNLRPDEKERLVAALLENYRPENQVYRYNFFYDNCATRPRDRIERAVDGTVLYAEDMVSTHVGVTFRSLIYHYTEQHLWARFSIDFCLGSPADQPINRRAMMFIPFYVRDFFAKAQIADNSKLSITSLDTVDSMDLVGSRRPLVSKEETLLDMESLSTSGSWTDFFTPMCTFLLLLLLISMATLYGIFTRRSLWVLDVLLFFAAGVAGCVVAFLFFFSQHPAVSPNYLLIVFHPLHLLFLPYIYIKVKRKELCCYMVVVGIMLTLFIALSAVIPQKINAAVLPLTACLLVRIVSNIILSYKSNE